MPTRPKKGSTPHQNAAGRAKGGGQKAVTGSGRSPKEAQEAKQAVVNHEEQARPDEE
ncbi:MAG: hypothetical protein M3203_01710 [Actinomycetota bacterium]|nr:hypothetical protein [Actinomycetota bacterium]